MSIQDLAQVELLCKQLYEATDTISRGKAEAALVAFSTSPDCLPKCQLLLERGDVSGSTLSGRLSNDLPVVFSSLKSTNLNFSFSGVFSILVLVRTASCRHYAHKVGDQNTLSTLDSATSRHSKLHFELSGFPAEAGAFRDTSTCSVVCTHHQAWVVRNGKG